MGDLSSELARVVDAAPRGPRVYVDANMPFGVVSFLRTTLCWDVFFVMEHDDLRRARDSEHFRAAKRLRRTLVTLDHDYLDPKRFPPAEGSGVIVVSAPDERATRRVLVCVHREVFRGSALPLDGRTLHVDLDWLDAQTAPAEVRSRRTRRRRPR